MCPAQGEVECNQMCINPLNTDAYCGATQGCGQGGVGTAGDACITGVETCINGQCVLCSKLETAVVMVVRLV